MVIQRSTTRPVPAALWSLVLRQVAFLFVAAGSFLPWLVVAGRSRDGYSSAEILLSLAETGALEALRFLGLLWYVGAFLALIGWAIGTLATGRVGRWTARGCLAVGLVAWLMFALWAASSDFVILEPTGPLVGLTGCVGLVLSELGRPARTIG